MNDLSHPTENLPALQQPGMPASVNAGAVVIEQERAIAEARGQMQLAKMFPRSVSSSIAEFLDACRSKDFADTAFYSVPNRGSGPSIRFAEEAARCYGNFEYGHRELSRSEGKSEIEVYAWDKEKNNQSKRQITVMHVRDTRDGPRKLTDQADIDNKIANVASKQIRGRILALLPKHLVAAGINECKRTLAGSNEKPMRERIIAMCGVFAKYGVTPEKIAKKLGHDTDSITLDELADLTGIYNALKDGAKASEYFPEVAPALTAPPAGDAGAQPPAPANQNEPPAQPGTRARGRPRAPEQPPTPPAGAQPPAESPAMPQGAQQSDPVSAAVPEQAATEPAAAPAPSLASVFGQQPAASGDDSDPF